MTILELIQKTSAFFDKAGVPDARLDTELLVAHVLHLKRMDLYLQFERVLNTDELDALRPLVRRRSLREPLQHILGETEFFNVRLKTTPEALIPRSETELLVSLILQHLPDHSPARILDIGTGTGAIAIALAKANPKFHLVATDISPAALALARENAIRNDVSEQIQWREGDLLAPLEATERFDVIVSNPPYIPSADIPSLQKEVQHDPVLALDGGQTGLDLLLHLIQKSPPFFKPNGALFLEMGHQHTEPLKQAMDSTGWNRIVFHNDLSGLPRIATALRPT